MDVVKKKLPKPQPLFFPPYKKERGFHSLVSLNSAHPSINLSSPNSLQYHHTYYYTYILIFNYLFDSDKRIEIVENLKRMGSEIESQLSLLGDEHKSLMESDSQNYGCIHYKRRCKIRAPCCDEIFDCRHCHNEAKDTLEVNPMYRHEIPRHEVKTVICSLCGTEQDVQQNCRNCGVCMGKYFCAKCNFFDDDVTKNQYHCDECGICRTGGEENFFHCKKCGCCYSKSIKDSHHCVERAMHHNCPVCFEFLFDTMKETTVLLCGHTIHVECVREMELHYRYSCPVCSKSICDLSNLWEKIDKEVASTPMPEMYKNKMVWILCNDCEGTSEVHFHIVGHKCLRCKSYNTRQIRGGPSSSSCTSTISQIVG